LVFRKLAKKELIEILERNRKAGFEGWREKGGDDESPLFTKRSSVPKGESKTVRFA
jgi:hypothetical protein